MFKIGTASTIYHQMSIIANETNILMLQASIELKLN